MAEDLEKEFGEMDADITDAVIEHTYGFEGGVIKSVMPLSQRSKRAKNAVISVQIELKSLEF